MDRGELNTGFLELGEAVQDMLIAKEYGKTDQIRQFQEQVSLIFEQLRGSNCHILVSKRGYYSSGSRKPDTIDEPIAEMCFIEPEKTAGETPAYSVEVYAGIKIDGTRGHILVEKNGVHVRYLPMTPSCLEDHEGEIERGKDEPLTLSSEQDTLKLLRSIFGPKFDG